MGEYSPSVLSAQAAGMKIEQSPYPEGAAGAPFSISKIVYRIREGKDDPRVRGWAGDTLIAAGKPTSIRARTQALLDRFRKETIYAPDPLRTEMINSAAVTLCLAPGMCIRARDCDDGCVTLGAACAAVGIPVRVLKQSYGPNVQEHVLIAVEDEQGQWLAADPSSDDLPVGRRLPAQHEEWYDPFAASIGVAGGSGGMGANFVGVGRPVDRKGGQRKSGQRERELMAVGFEPKSTLGPRGRLLLPYETEEARGMGAPAGPQPIPYQPVTDGQIHAGLRYRVGMQLSWDYDPAEAPYRAKQEALDRLGVDWVVESFDPVDKGGAVPAGDFPYYQGWILQGIAKHDFALHDDPQTKYLVVGVQAQAPTKPPVPPPGTVPNTPPTPPESDFASFAKALWIAGAVATAGGVAFYGYKAGWFGGRSVPPRRAVAAAPRRRRLR